MAHNDYVTRLKQGVQSWNRWWGLRSYGIEIDLSQLEWPEENLSWANLRYTNLTGANLRYTDLSWADLRHANLSEAKLVGATFYKTLYDEYTQWPDRFMPPPEAIQTDGSEIKICISNLPANYQEEAIHSLCKPYGEVLTCLLTEKENKPQALIEMHPIAGEQAIEALNGRSLPTGDLWVHRTPKVLLVEDNFENRILLSRALPAILACQLDCASDGQEALALIEKQSFDLCVIDWSLVGPITGWQLCSIIKHELKLQNTGTILMISNINWGPDRPKASELGIDAYLAKPVSFNDLWITIQRVLTQYNKLHLLGKLIA